MVQPIASTDTLVKLPMWLKIIVFAVPNMGVVFLFGPVIAVLGGIYAKYYGLSLTSIAAVILAAKLFDAITDPLIGYCSDRWRLKTGSRKPLILVGGLLLIPCAYLLFVPPNEVGVFYFSFWYMAFYLSYTLFTIPYLAWSHEFTETPQEKALVFSAINGAGQLGGALFYALPLVPFFMTTEISPAVLKATAIVGAALLLPGLYFALKLVPDGTVHETSKVGARQSIPMVRQIGQTVRELADNKPFLLFACISMLMGLAFGLWFGLLFIFVDAYLNLGEKFAQMSLWSMACAVLAIPFWYRMVVRWGKRLTWLVANCCSLMVFVFTGLLDAGHSGFWAVLILYLSMTFSFISVGVIFGPVLCDIIDYGCFQTGHERSGIYFSMMTLMAKIQGAIGGALGLAVIGWLGFDMNAISHSATSILGLKISISWLPVLFMIPAMVCIYRMPLNEHRMTIIRRRLAQRVADSGDSGDSDLNSTL